MRLSFYKQAALKLEHGGVGYFPESLPEQSFPCAARHSNEAATAWECRRMQR